MTLDPKFQATEPTWGPFAAVSPGGAGEGLDVLHIAYVAAAVILPLRLLVILRARAEVPVVHERLLQRLKRGEGAGHLRSSNPYADLARSLATLAEGGASQGELERARQRALRKSGRRNVRSQALDAASLLLLLSLSLLGGRGLPLGPTAAWAAALLGLMLLGTIFARGSLQHRLDTAIRDLERELRGRPQSPSFASACVFCGAEVGAESGSLSLGDDPEGEAIPVRAVVCRSCGKVVATLPAERRGV